jgi:D-glycero-alpha-D-manno-heptose 1-phosphate guanylyltransferase
MQLKEAIILAGGLGTRLRSAVPELPKCMAPVAGKPFLAYVIHYLRKQGIEKFIFALGYKNELFNDFINSALPSNDYLLSIENEPLGTGGAIKLACSKATQDTVLATNGDTFFDITLKKLAAFHHMAGADCTISLKRMKNFDRYGVVELNNDYSIKNFREKQWYENGLINGGVYALNTGKFLAENLPHKFSFEKDYLEKFFTSRRMFGVVQNEYFIDIGIPEDYVRAQEEFASNKW